MPVKDQELVKLIGSIDDVLNSAEVKSLAQSLGGVNMCFQHDVPEAVNELTKGPFKDSKSIAKAFENGANNTSQAIKELTQLPIDEAKGILRNIKRKTIKTPEGKQLAENILASIEALGDGKDPTETVRKAFDRKFEDALFERVKQPQQGEGEKPLPEHLANLMPYVGRNDPPFTGLDTKTKGLEGLER